MAIPEDKERERKRGCSEGAHLCAITLRSSAWSWGLPSGNWTTSHYTKGPSPELYAVWSDLELTPPVPCPWHDSKRNSGYSAHHSPLFSWLLQKSRESRLRCMLQHVPVILIVIRQQILFNYKHHGSPLSGSKCVTCGRTVKQQVDLSQVNKTNLQIHQERAKN